MSFDTFFVLSCDELQLKYLSGIAFDVLICDKELFARTFHNTQIEISHNSKYFIFIKSELM